MKGWTWYVVSFATILTIFGCSGCAWETEAGNSPQDANDFDGTDSLEYPKAPYGTEYADTVENLQLERVICMGDDSLTRAWKLEEFLGSKAVLLSVHAGWCNYCKQQAATMETELQRPYASRGLNIVLVMTEDPTGNSQQSVLADFACKYRSDYGFSFTVAIDPKGATTGKYFDGVPLNMLLDSNMSIRYKIVGLPPDSSMLEGNIEGLLNE